MHNFRNDLAESERLANSPFVQLFYSSSFREFTSQYVTDIEAQKSGIDRIISTASGSVKIEEKFQKTLYDNILLEEFSSVGNNSPGWINKHLSCDFICYFILQRRKCYVIKYNDLERAWKEHEEEIKQDSWSIYSFNEGYKTKCWPIYEQHLKKYGIKYVVYQI